MTSTASPSSSPERVFGWREHTALWFSLGVGLLVMQVGAYLVPAMGTRDAALAVVGGSILGAGLLAWVAWLGCTSGQTSAGLIRTAYGQGFARLPILLNVVQLLGWATFELVVMRDGTRAIARQALGIDPGLVAPTLLWGVIVLLLLRGSMLTLVRRIVSRVGLPLVVLSLLWLSVQFGLQLQASGLDALWQRAGDGSMNGFQALDLVIAMPVSWLPLVADYARYGRSARGTLSGIWLGYIVANLWCYALGVVVVSTAPADADLLATMLLAQGGLIALGFILIDEVDNAYGDVHSGAVSAHYLTRSRWSIRRLGIGLAALATAAALALPIHSLEPFLLLLSSVFVPLFGVVLSQLAGGDLPAARAVRAGPALLWLAGIACFHLGSAYWPQWGSALPCLAFTLIGGWLLRLLPQGPRPTPSAPSP